MFNFKKIIMQITNEILEKLQRNFGLKDSCYQRNSGKITTKFWIQNMVVTNQILDPERQPNTGKNRGVLGG